LRTPLTAVRLQAALARQASTAEERAGALQDLEAGLGRAAHLIEQLLAMARLDAEPTGRLEPVDLLSLAKTVVVEQSPIADSKALDLGLLSGEPATIAGDPTELRALLDNLVGNALRYTPTGGRVDVEVRQTETGAVLAVSDTGPGIPPAERRRVFDRFYRGADAAAPGSGLGLAIVRRIADRHHARIDLGSSENGSGLRVTVRFPSVRAGV
ncbi:MAG TPA: histidine kinase, partial [Candidatus Competibacteraceae bacterium]|nr:histidine kinase [Candidatus Competibacteraceae bacterium]